MSQEQDSDEHFNVSQFILIIIPAYFQSSHSRCGWVNGMESHRVRTQSLLPVGTATYASET